MTLFVNLSSIHHYDLKETLKAFISLCEPYRQGSLVSTSEWMTIQYKNHLKELIEPYKLGKIDTKQFIRRALQDF